MVKSHTQIAKAAHYLWEGLDAAPHSPYICDCIQAVTEMDQFVTVSGEDFLTQEARGDTLVQFVCEQIEHCYSVGDFLFGEQGKYEYTLTADERDLAHRFREDLWDKIFVYAEELDEELVK